MTNTSLIDADTLLAVDVGAVNTRAILFDSVEEARDFFNLDCDACRPIRVQ